MSDPAFGLEFLAHIAEDDRLSGDDLREVVLFACSSYAGGEVDKTTKAKASHAAGLLIKAFAASRSSRDLADLSDRFAKYPPISSADLHAALARAERFRKRDGESDDEARDRIKKLIREDEANGRDPPEPDANENAAAILRAAAIARGQITELPAADSEAMRILKAHARARNEPEPGGKL